MILVNTHHNCKWGSWQHGATGAERVRVLCLEQAHLDIGPRAV